VSKLGLKQRLESKISRDPNTGCWIWTAARNNYGYGTLSVDGKQKKASRVTYELYRGPIPQGFVLDHYRYPEGGCVGPGCVNPYHLLITTKAANAGRTAWIRKNRCPKGHEYTAGNTYIESTGRGGKGRRCRTCRINQVAKWQKRNPEKVRGYRKKSR
jgi:hypothetical protein